MPFMQLAPHNRNTPDVCDFGIFSFLFAQCKSAKEFHTKWLKCIEFVFCFNKTFQPNGITKSDKKMYITSSSGTNERWSTNKYYFWIKRMRSGMIARSVPQVHAYHIKMNVFQMRRVRERESMALKLLSMYNLIYSRVSYISFTFKMKEKQKPTYERWNERRILGKMFHGIHKCLR